MTEPASGSALLPVGRPRPPWSVVVVALSLALLCLTTATVALLIADDEVDGGPTGDLEAVRAEALEAARDRTLALTSYDHRTLDRDFAEVLEAATGAFEQEYRATTGRLADDFRRAQAVAEADVVAVGLESVEVPEDGPDRAVAVVAVDQVITTAGAAPRTERNRLRMELVRPQDTWLVARVERL